MRQVSKSTMHLRDYIPRAATSFPENLAYVDAHARSTWPQMHARSDMLAAALLQLGIEKGQASAILCMNRIELAEHWFACLKLGIVRAGVNWRYSRDEMLHTIRDCDAKTLFVEARCMDLLGASVDDLLREGRQLIGIGNGHGLPLDYETVLRRTHGRPDLPPLADDDVAMIGYTSGTTGAPKGVMLTQRNIRESSIQSNIVNGYSPDDVRLYCTNPAGINIFQMCFNVISGMTTVVHDYDTRQTLDLIEEHRITTCTLVPTMLRRLLDQLDSGHHDVSSLKMIAYGTMPSTPALIRAAYDTLGCRFVQRYGVSESSGAVAALLDSDHRLAISGQPELLTSIGRPMVHADIEIRDDEGNPLADGETGTVWIRGATVMAGYLNLPEETAQTLFPPWLKTGDIGRKDASGYIYLSDRKKHMIISGGFNVYPVVVENVLEEHPAVAESVVCGVPHPDWGEAVVAAVSLRPGAGVETAELVELCRTKLAKWEVPKFVEIMKELPRGNTDKLDKKAVHAIITSSGRLPWVV